MKPFNKFALVALAVAACWGTYQEVFHEEEGDMEYLHNRVGIHQVDCTKTDNLEGHAWLACRWGDNGDWGSVWVRWEDPDGPVWMTWNGKAIQVVNRLQELPSDMRPNSISVRRNTPEDSATKEYASLPSGVPWARLQ